MPSGHLPLCHCVIAQSHNHTIAQFNLTSGLHFASGSLSLPTQLPCHTQQSTKTKIISLLPTSDHIEVEQFMLSMNKILQSLCIHFLFLFNEASHSSSMSGLLLEPDTQHSSLPAPSTSASASCSFSALSFPPSFHVSQQLSFSSFSIICFFVP